VGRVEAVGVVEDEVGWGWVASGWGESHALGCDDLWNEERDQCGVITAICFFDAYSFDCVLLILQKRSLVRSYT
jgi:hypothetical protein